MSWLVAFSLPLFVEADQSGKPGWNLAGTRGFFSKLAFVVTL